uniref:Uncharacterized protein n=1 Tax=Haptolina ericina TaxID=156174 RepID=A0A7S3FD73_9EUKA
MQLRFDVVVPEGAGAGTWLLVNCEQQRCMLVIPDGTSPGDTLSCAPAWRPSEIAPPHRSATGQVTIEVPLGVDPGEHVTATTAGGRTVQFTVPHNLPASRKMRLSLPSVEVAWDGCVASDSRVL